jgi:hypothetical protein
MPGRLGKSPGDPTGRSTPGDRLARAIYFARRPERLFAPPVMEMSAAVQNAMDLHRPGPCPPD